MTTPAEQLQQSIVEQGYWDEFKTISIEFFRELIDYGIESLEQFEDSYQGQYKSGAEFAEQITDECGYLESNQGVPDFILNHIDWESVWSCELRFDYFEVDGHYFRNF